MERWTTEDGEAYISCDSLSVGDYGGAGSVGAANIRVLEDRDDAFVSRGSHGYRQLWLADTPENRELVESLERDYHVLDDGAVSEIESEWELEAWNSWLRSDLIGSLPDAIRYVGLDLPDEDLWTCYRAAMEANQTYPEPEHSGVYVDVERISAAFADGVEAMILRDNLPLFPLLASFGDGEQGPARDYLLDSGADDELADAIVWCLWHMEEV